MKHFFYAVIAGVVLVGAVALSQPAPKVADPSVDPMRVQVEDRNPWTHLKVNNSAEDFQFVVVSDRTGGHREKIFSRAVEQINLLQPEFVLSVGDLIEGYTDTVGSDVDNLSLSDRRAESVAIALTQQFNVPPENLSSQGYGEQFLKVQVDGPERANRRVAVRRVTPLITGEQR